MNCRLILCEFRKNIAKIKNILKILRDTLMKIKRNCKIECQQFKIPAEWEVARPGQMYQCCQHLAAGRGAARAQTPDPGRAFTCTQATCRPPVLMCLPRDHATRVLREVASPDPDPGPRPCLRTRQLTPASLTSPSPSSGVQRVLLEYEPMRCWRSGV